MAYSNADTHFLTHIFEYDYCSRRSDQKFNHSFDNALKRIDDSVKEILKHRSVISNCLKNALNSDGLQPNVVRQILIDFIQNQ